MARNTADACMFCGCNPCACGKSAKKAGPPKVTRVRPERSAQQAAGEAREPVAQPTARPSLASVERVRDPGTEQLSYAITLFAERDMLHHTSLAEHRDLIRLPKNAIDAKIWRQKHDELRRDA